MNEEIINMEEESVIAEAELTAAMAKIDGYLEVINHMCVQGVSQDSVVSLEGLYGIEIAPDQFYGAFTKKQSSFGVEIAMEGIIKATYDAMLVGAKAGFAFISKLISAFIKYLSNFFQSNGSEKAATAEKEYAGLASDVSVDFSEVIKVYLSQYPTALDEFIETRPNDVYSLLAVSETRVKHIFNMVEEFIGAWTKQMTAAKKILKIKDYSSAEKGISEIENFSENTLKKLFTSPTNFGASIFTEFTLPATPSGTVAEYMTDNVFPLESRMVSEKDALDELKKEKRKSVAVDMSGLFKAGISKIDLNETLAVYNDVKKLVDKMEKEFIATSDAAENMVHKTSFNSGKEDLVVLEEYSSTILKEALSAQKLMMSILKGLNYYVQVITTLNGRAITMMASYMLAVQNAKKE